VPSIELCLGQAYPVAFSGFRTVLEALDDHGLTIRQRLLARYPAEATVLTPQWCDADGATIASVALTPSERRLHPESEQTFRVLQAAADIVIMALSDHRVPIRLRAAGAADVPSIRGLMRLVEIARFRGLADLITISGLADRSLLSQTLIGQGFEPPEATQLADRLTLAEDTDGHPLPDPPGSGLLPRLRDEQADAADRIAIAVEAGRQGFFQSDLEVMAFAALTGLRLCPPDQHIDGVTIADTQRRLGLTSSWTEAVEFEAGVMRGAADVRAFFRKLLGIVRSFRRQNPQAIDEFTKIAEDESVSVELRAQAMLYRALTKVKMMRNPAAGRSEAEQGLSLLDKADTSDTVERERGWLYNVRALCAFSEHDYGNATKDEKAALACVAGKSDTSSLHLKINLVSNISVLQERAGRPAAALNTWERFRNVGTAWDTIFRKHHSYRTAGLALAAGDAERAVEGYSDSLAACDTLDDAFHRAAIGLELGALRDPAAHYRAAIDHANQLGDPYQHALAEAGLALAEGRVPVETERARLSLTYPRQAGELCAAMQSGDPQRIGALLPKPRTKLNRPFDHINLF